MSSATPARRKAGIFGWPRGIRVTGSKPVSVDHNVIVPVAPLGGTGISVNLNTSASTTVNHNTIIGEEGGVIGGNATVQFAQNHCDPDNPNCATCISSHYCAGPAVDVCRETPVIMKPSSNGDTNEFTLLKPSTTPASLHWLLVTDAPAVEPTQMSLFGYCTLKAKLIGEGPSTAIFSLKRNGVFSDSAEFAVDYGYSHTYERVMATNPFTSQAWTDTDLTDGTLQIGVKSSGGTSGFDLGDIVLECE